MLGISLLAPARGGSKRSDSTTKARAQGTPHAKKKRRLKRPDERRGRAGGGETQSQPRAVVRGRQEQRRGGRGHIKHNRQ